MTMPYSPKFGPARTRRNVSLSPAELAAHLGGAALHDAAAGGRETKAAAVDGGGCAKFILLDIGDMQGWQKASQAITLCCAAGAPIVVSTSPNGHDAAAVHLDPTSETNIAADCWFTFEPLGVTSLVRLSVASTDMQPTELAPADWFPTPRAPA